MFLSDINKGEIFTNLLQSLNERAERGTFPELSLLSNSRKGREKSHDVIAQNTSGPGKTPYRDMTNAYLQGNSALYDPSRNEAERVYALLIHHHYCYSSVNKQACLFVRLYVTLFSHSRLICHQRSAQTERVFVIVKFQDFVYIFMQKKVMT